MKSAVVNQVINQQRYNIRINEILRKNILEQKKERDLIFDDKFKKKVDLIYKVLPANRKSWAYNAEDMEHLKPLIDAISKSYLEHYHKEDIKELQRQLQKREAVYREAYGENHRNGSFAENKIQDLYTRLGNAILSDLKKYDKELKAEYYRHLKMRTLKGNRSFAEYQKNAGIGKLAATLKKTMSDELRRHSKNLRVYEEMQQKSMEELQR